VTGLLQNSYAAKRVGLQRDPRQWTAAGHPGRVRGRLRLGWLGWLLEELGLEPLLVHPSRRKAIAAARLQEREGRRWGRWRSCYGPICRPRPGSRLASVIAPRFRALVLVGAYGGLRIGELAGLRRGRTDTARGTVTVLEIATDVSGRLVFGPPKTRAARRTVSLPAPVANELEQHLASYAEPHPDALVFTAARGSALRATNFRRRTWRPAVRAAELDDLRIHDLRHTAVALWIAAGASPKEVARRAGHTSVKTVLDVYGHLYAEADVALRERLEAMFVPVVAALPMDLCGPTGPRKPAVSLAAVRLSSGTPGLTSAGSGLPGLELETSSLPWNHQEPLCGGPFPQVTRDRRGLSYRFSFGQVMRLVLIAQMAHCRPFGGSNTLRPASSRRGSASGGS
jgi:hypothetical protein